MSAEILRKAASLMRERATTAPVPAGPWETEFSDVIRTDVPFGAPGYMIAECADLAEAKHIASWHPAVALAVADLLDAEVEMCEAFEIDETETPTTLTIARAYLGEAS